MCSIEVEFNKSILQSGAILHFSIAVRWEWNLGIYLCKCDTMMTSLKK